MIKQATISELHDATKLVLQLWPNHEEAEMEMMITAYIKSSHSAIFLSYESNLAVGICVANLRNDYVEGTHSIPVGYLEGIYVIPSHQQQGIGKRLLSACVQWAKSKGCTEFASDCELNNATSLDFHLKLGFKEANRIICFTQKI